jgi:hypothetical protein
MTKQLSLFPAGPENPAGSLLDDKIAALATALNPVDEIFASTARYQNIRILTELLTFIARFPNYSPFNGLLLYIQNPEATYVATARNWLQKFRRQPKFDARPLFILAPKGPILFVFDIHDTEGEPAAPALQQPPAAGQRTPAKIYANTLHNCALHGIAVYETSAEKAAAGPASRITPALRKEFNDFSLEKDTSYLVLINKSQSLEDKYSSLVHELGHIFCGHLGIDRHAWWPERENSNLNGEDLEADAVAYLVCRRLGWQAQPAKLLTRLLEKNHPLPVFSLNALLQAATYAEELGSFRWKAPRKRHRR